MQREQLDVLAALAQRRQVEVDRVEPEEQVLAELAGGDLGRQVGIGGGDQADVGAAGARRADALELAGLERAQELRLLAHRDVADLVHEQRAAVGQFEAAGAVGSWRR